MISEGFYKLIVCMKYSRSDIMNTHRLDGKAISFVRKNKVVSTNEIANYLNISWNTAEKYLLELALANKLRRVKKLGTNLWLIKK